MRGDEEAAPKQEQPREVEGRVIDSHSAQSPSVPAREQAEHER
jgi:hypothetical protein